MTRLILTRHGQTVWNSEKRVQGSLDSPLTETGLLQTRALAMRLAGEQIGHIYASHAPRAVSTANELARMLGLNRIHIAPDLRELSFGEWEGAVWQDLRTANPDVFRIWDTTPYLVTPPGGETMAAVMERAWNCVQQILPLHPDETICLVTHGLTLHLLVTKALGLEVRDWFQTPRQQNTALNIFEITGEIWTPKLLGDCAHLAELDRTPGESADAKN